jgi:putative membrane protein
MLHTNARFSEAVEAEVGRLEADTDAEVVVVAAPRSGSYRDLALAFGLAVAWLLLLLVLFSPFPFQPAWIPLELPALVVLATWAAHRRPGLLRLLAGPRRRKAQVDAAADATFHQEVVHGTQGRTGLLIYFSALEQRVVLRPDLGLDARVPGAEWNAIRWGSGADPHTCHDLDAFLQGLRAVGQVLARHVPPTGSNPNEISDAPRIRT